MPPECWKTATLGDYAKVIMGQSPESQYYTTDCNNMPFLQGNRTFGSKYPSFDTYTTKVTKLAPKGSVIISVRAPVGDTNVAPSELCLGRGVAALQSEDPDNEFLYYLVKSLVPLMNQNENGSTFGSINRTDLEKLPIDLPDYEERYKIGQVLSALDSKIELNQQINANLLQQSKAIFEQLVVKTNERTELSLTDIANFQNGLAMQKNRPIEDNWLPVLKIKELGQGYCDESSERCRSDLDESVLIHDGDVVFSWSGSLMSKIWCGGDAGLNQHLFKVTSSDYPLWFYYCWLQYHIPNFIDIAANKATTMGHICRNHLEDAIVWKPNEEVMKKVDQTLSPLFDQYIALSIESKKLSCLRDYLLPKLISGEIDVSNLPLPN